MGHPVDVAKLLQGYSSQACFPELVKYDIWPKPSSTGSLGESSLHFDAINVVDTSRGEASRPLVSILMPVFNEEKTVAQALESALFQRTNFEFEVIVVNDCSTDETSAIVETYHRSFSNLRVLNNEQNCGKGVSVMRAYAAALGKYFHVLDGDDIFVSWDKLQKQVDFLEGNDEFFAIGHNSAILHPEEKLAFVSPHIVPRDVSYKDCVANRIYCHTSSYLFRKIGSELPNYFSKKFMRGDTALFFYHAFKSKLKVRYVPDVSSLYNFHGNGLWSSLEHDERSEINIGCLECLRDDVVADPESEEHGALQKRIDFVRQASPAGIAGRKTASLDQLLSFCGKTASRVFVPEVRSAAFKGMYSFQAIDQLCELAGRLTMYGKDYRLAHRSFDEKRAVFLVSGLVPDGGGIFKEIKELIAILLKAGFNISIFSSSRIATDRSIIDEHFNDPRIEYWSADPKAPPSKQLESLIDKLWHSAPGRIYPFVTHHDAVLSASLQRGLGGQIILDFVYDHGLSFAVHNTSIDKIIVKTRSQAEALASRIDPDKFVFVPPFIVDKYKRNPYVPLRNGRLTTASAAARPYKVENDYRFSYFRIISDVLATTGGVHYHYGPLNEEYMALIKSELSRNGIDPARFIHIPWADDLGGSFLENGIDLFLAPFPVCSARIAIEVMSCGIPSMNHNAEMPLLPQAIDFTDPDQWTWNSSEDLLLQVSRMDAPALAAKSDSARRYFVTHNDSDLASSHVLQMTGLDLKLSGGPLFELADICKAGLIDLDRTFYGAVPSAPAPKPAAAIAPPEPVTISEPAPRRTDEDIEKVDETSFLGRIRRVRQKIIKIWQASLAA